MLILLLLLFFFLSSSFSSLLLSSFVVVVVVLLFVAPVVGAGVVVVVVVAVAIVVAVVVVVLLNCCCDLIMGIILYLKAKAQSNRTLHHNQLPQLELQHKQIPAQAQQKTRDKQKWFRLHHAQLKLRLLHA